MKELDNFGKVISEDLRDAALNRYLDIESGNCASSAGKELSASLEGFTSEQKSIIRRLLSDAVDSGVHDFLFSLESSDDIKVLSSGRNVQELSDGLNGEIFTEDGWFEKYSQHPESGI